MDVQCKTDEASEDGSVGRDCGLESKWASEEKEAFEDDARTCERACNE